MTATAACRWWEWKGSMIPLGIWRESVAIMTIPASMAADNNAAVVLI